MNEQTETFKQHYQRLNRIAEELRVQTEPDLDALVGKVDEALVSYKFCQARIDAVKKLLDEKMSGLDPAQP
jgi:exodeoxyribonuclease VII small subunit